MITITENAKKYLYDIAKKNDKKFVSFGVSGGCLLYTSDAADDA